MDNLGLRIEELLGHLRTLIVKTDVLAAEVSELKLRVCNPTKPLTVMELAERENLKSNDPKLTLLAVNRYAKRHGLIPTDSRRGFKKTFSLPDILAKQHA